VGIDLGDLVKREPTTLAAWQGKRVAVDAWNVLYQFLSGIRSRDGSPLMDSKGRITSHLAGVLHRSAAWHEAGLKPVWVFDGKAHPLKRETLAVRSARRQQAEVDYAQAVEAGDEERARTKAQQAMKMTWEMADEAKDLLRALGIPVVEAPSEGEAQAAWMAATGVVDAVVSQDFDVLLFGGPVVLRNMASTGKRKLPGKQVWTNVEPECLRLDAAQLPRDLLVEVALLVGTDFHPGIKGIGAKKAAALISKYHGLEPLLAKLAKEQNPESAAERAILEQHESLLDRDAVRELFLHPPHVECDMSAAKIQPDSVRRLLVEERGFDVARIDSALEKFGAKGPVQQRLF